jgi:CDGSH-type Zn-finger protein
MTGLFYNLSKTNNEVQNIQNMKGAVSMDKPVVSQKNPIAIDVKKGETYYWCACGKSASQPFCDGSHKGTTHQPLAFTAEKDETIYLCACKQTKNPPFCDGTHKNL